ncbi:MAG: outer membrane protein assembly factor BamE [Proteobacteria bacterium]|nr:outer membrane protein assembly factor BamE [Pseudomonadota bacterium]MBI3496030.1 outer membrane protein assembly factor BamE [Pseudomonadota bacterium]
MSFNACRRIFSIAAVPALVMGLACSGCTPLVDARGNLPDAQSLDSIQPGIATRADVTGTLGSPSSMATFDPNVWFYISKRTETVAFFDPDVLDQNVVQITFDGDGRVASIKRYGMDDAENVRIAERVTPTAGQSLTLLQQLFGNLGRFVGNNSSTGGRSGP